MSNRSYFFSLILVGVLIYFPVLFKGFKQDDISQIVHFSLVHSLKNIPEFFTSGFKYPGNHTNVFYFYYKPLMFSLFTFLYSLGKGSPVPFHFLQLVLYIANSLLLFHFFSKFLGEKIAGLLSFLFLLFPGNVEVASYIANLQDNLFFFFGIGSLCLVQINNYKKSKTFFISIFLLCALLSKETGILFLILVPLYSFLFQKKFLKLSILSSILVSIMYLALRGNASQHSTLFLLDTPVQHLNFIERIPVAISIIGFYIQELFLPTVKYPLYLSIGRIPLLQIIVYSITDVIFIGTFVFVGNLFKKNKNLYKVFLFFSIWFFMGILFHSQLFFSLDVFVAARWLYLPLAGFLGVVGVILENYKIQKIFKNRLFRVSMVTLFFIYILETVYSVLFLS